MICVYKRFFDVLLKKVKKKVKKVKKTFDEEGSIW